jgi:hypothetical protein
VDGASLAGDSPVDGRSFAGGTSLVFHQSSDCVGVVAGASLAGAAGGGVAAGGAGSVRVTGW